MQRAKKQVHKTKEQLLAELRSNSAFIMKMKFIRETFWPALLEASSGIEDTLQMLSGFNTAVMQEFLGRMKDVKMSELNLAAKLDANAPKSEENKKLLAIFDDMDVFEAKGYIEGMKQEIEMFLADERKDRLLSSLKTKWLDEI